jgi:NAD-dependent dihydropyrimidine dehydrogenase PreA subunit
MTTLREPEPVEFEWGPTLDADLCTDCRTCLEFCQNGVYALIDDHVRVVAKTACMEGCSHCATMCESGALSFPTLEELRAARGCVKPCTQQ